MNRNLILIAIAAVAIVGIGVGLLLPALQGGPLAGSVVPNWTTSPVTMVRTTGPSGPVPNVSITMGGTYSPYKRPVDQSGRYEWYWKLHSVAAYDATRLPPGVLVETVHRTITAARSDGGTKLCSSSYIQGVGGLPVTDSYTIDDLDTHVGCDVENSDFCPSTEWIFGPPFIASCTVTTTDGTSYTESIELIFHP